MSNMISIIIPTLNEDKYIGKTLEAISRQDWPKGNVEIIVVDNGSSDRTIQISKKFDTKILVNEKKGAAASRNCGAAVASGDIIGFIDADCIIPPDWIKTLSSVFTDKEVIAIASRVAPSPDEATWVEKSWERVFVDHGKIGEFNPVDSVGLSNLLIRKKVFWDAGGFSENLITCEDYEFSKRILKYGALLKCNTIKTIHLRESKGIKELFVRELWRGSFSWESFKMNNYEIKEVPSIMLPFIFVLSLLIIPISLIVGLDLFILNIIFSLVIPSIYYVRAGITNDVIGFFSDYLVICTYLAARGISILGNVFNIRFERPNVC